MKRQDPAHEVVVIERNRPERHLRLGRGLLDKTLGQPAGGRSADRPSRDPRRVQPLGRHRGASSGGADAALAGHGFCGIGRKRLLNILQARCEAELGVQSAVRDRRCPDDTGDRRRPDHRLPTASTAASARNMRRLTSPTSTCAAAASSGWARSKLFDAFTFAFEKTEARLVPGARRTASMPTPRPSSSRRPRRSGSARGLDAMSKEEAIAFCERLFAKYLDGHALM
jgi:anthraniloyl-CoA monooxygenase